MTETRFAHIFTTMNAKLRNSHDSMLPNNEKDTVADELPENSREWFWANVKLGRGFFLTSGRLVALYAEPRHRYAV